MHYKALLLLFLALVAGLFAFWTADDNTGSIGQLCLAGLVLLLGLDLLARWRGAT
jgi:hypothetical protein